MQFYKILGPVILGWFLILCFEIMYHRKKDEHNRENAKKRFWDKEAKANSVRRKDISYLDYISVPVDRLPFIKTDDDELLEYHRTIKSLSEKKILNLNGITNTDLKLQYGPANLTDLSEFDDNYITLVNTIAKWGARLFSLGNTEEAASVLEYGIEVGTDVSRNYTLLAKIYKESGRIDEIDTLINKAESLDSIMKKTILEKLNEIKNDI